MSKTILVTGPDLDPSAAALVTEKGYRTEHTPAYADSGVISEMLNRTGAVGIVSRMGRLDSSVMDAAPQLRVISKHGVGVDNIDIAAAAARGIPVLVATGANAVSVAEHTIALLLAAVKRVLPLDNSLREGRWEKPGFAGRELSGSTLGLVGMGAIAQATAHIAKGLGLELIGFDPFAKDSAFVTSGVRRCATVDQLFTAANIVSLHCPMTPQTEKLVNSDTIGSMPTGSYIINTARGGLIDEDALISAIQSGQLSGAGLDTFAVEPPRPDHPFFAENRIVLTPHIGGVTREAGARVGLDAVRGIFHILEGAPIAPERIVNRRLLANSAKAQPHTEEK